MFEQFILGFIQGVAEWLPVSSEGMILLSKEALFQHNDTFHVAIQQALLLHFGTFLAALVYFRKDVRRLLKGCLHYGQQTAQTKKTIQFLIISTLISGAVGLCLLKFVEQLLTNWDPHGRPITTLIGILLLGTAFLELKTKRAGYKSFDDLKLRDSILLGLVQGCAALPGFSRSGLTVSALLLCKFDKITSLKLSFLMSLPIVLGGNIFLHAGSLEADSYSWAGILSAFVFGLATIHLLLKIAEKINFGYFVLFFGLLTIASTFI